MTGCVFSIEEFSVFDGPGIRTTVFMKGCPLSCSWCHNPEGQSESIEIVRSPNGCIGCGECIRFSEESDGKYIFSEQSIQSCPRSLLRYSGEIISSDCLVQKLLKNERILKNGGGVTFSGGEPLYQGDFVVECIEKLKGRLHTAIQTSGFCREDIFDKALDAADYFLYDLKLADDVLHRRYTGVSNSVILKNFEKLAARGKDFTVRIPLIPGVTDTVENITGMAGIMKKNGVKYAELLPYNKMAGGKYKMLQREYRPDFDETKEVEIHGEILEKSGIEYKVM